MSEPLCPYFRRCGGCLYQDIDYQEQLRKKLAEFKLAIGHESVEVFSSDPYFYRTRMDFIFHSEGLGLRERRRWWRIVDVSRCVIAVEPLNRLIQEIRDFFLKVDAFDVRLKRGTFRFAVIRTPPGDSSISFVLNKESTNSGQALELIEKFSEKTSARNIITTFVPPNRDVSISDDFRVIKGRPYLEEEILGKKFLYPVQGFFQNNHEMSEKLHRYCRSILENYSSHRTSLLDLYAGVGTFGLLNADLYRDVYLLENYPESLEAAKKNIINFGLKNISTILEDAKNIPKLTFPFSLVVVADPPRTGLHPRALKYLNLIKPKSILYISCNISQLQQDLASLSEYFLQRAAIFDFFPKRPI